MAAPEPVEAGARSAPQRPDEPSPDVPRLSELEFPGCTPVHLPVEEIGDYEGRLEFWDATTETAWVCEPTSPYHERPSRLLTRLAERIAGVRGSPVECYGSMDLLLRDAQGKPRRILQADESVYLHPARARLPGDAAMVIGEDDFPDVVLEVDHTTDVYRGKLRLYESWAFPEVWVDVPDRDAASRSKSRAPGLTIHVLEDGAYRVSAESLAFPGWTAEEIHRALNETAPSVRTSLVLERVGAALGAREGTGPDDDPLFRSLRRQSRAEGLAEGERKGRTEGERKGRADTLAKMARRMLLSRGVEVSEGFLADPAFAASSEDAVFDAALTCTNEAEFLTALGQSRT